MRAKRTTAVIARVCSAQGAVIVRNNRSSAFSTTARVDLWAAEQYLGVTGLV